MFFKRKEKVEPVEHKKYCPRCNATDDLMPYTKRKNAQGVLVVYYVCHTCNRKDKKRYYDAGNQKRFVDNNRRYRHKKYADSSLEF